MSVVENFPAPSLLTAGGDALTGATVGLRVAGLFNDATGTVDRMRGNTGGTLLASAARTASTTSPVQTNVNARGVLILLNVTAASGTGGLQVRIQAIDPVSGVAVNLNTAPTAIVATQAVPYQYLLYPGAVAANGNTNQLVALPLPRTWQALVTHGDASSYTYSLGFLYLL